jgi:thiol-disulfide isomerase/thioredoxin
MAAIFKQVYVPYLLVILGVVLIFVWARSCGAGAGANAKEGFENNGLDASYITAAPYKFHMYFVDWCPHCIEAKPEFAKLESKTTIGGKSVICEAIEAEKNPEKVLGKPEGYPTIQLYDPQGKLVKEYSGERTASGFRSFLEDVLNRP